MRENVGRKDRIARSFIGPTLISLGYRKFGGRGGRIAGIATIVGGAMLIETAISRVCPLNALFGLDTRTRREKERDRRALPSDAQWDSLDTPSGSRDRVSVYPPPAPIGL